MARKARAKTSVTAKKTTKKKSTTTKPSKQRTMFGVAIEKVLEKMKAIVEGNKEQEFLRKCAELGDDRFVTVNSRIVRLVKEFEAEHGLRPEPTRGATTPATRGLSPAAVNITSDETSFKH